MRIGILGGSFNPPHNLHYQMAEEALNRNLVDKIIYVPTGDRYAKDGLIEGHHRYNMLRLMCESNSKLEVSDYEISRGASYTYETLDYFKSRYQTDEIYFIMSSDLILDIYKWKNADYILSNYKILGITRSGVEMDELPDIYNKHNSLTMYDFCLRELSSTIVRDKIKNNEKLNDDLNEKVLAYILDNQLYK